MNLFQLTRNTKISKIFGYASINATGLLGKNLDKKKYLSCAEIRLFAVAKALRGNEAIDSDGLDLYTKFGFVHSEDYLLPEDEEKIDIEDCTPLVFSFLGEDALYKLFE